MSAGEFDDVEDDLKGHFDVTRSAKDRKVHASVASYPGDNEGDVVVQSFLTIEFTRCDPRAEADHAGGTAALADPYPVGAAGPGRS